MLVGWTTSEKVDALTQITPNFLQTTNFWLLIRGTGKTSVVPEAGRSCARAFHFLFSNTRFALAFSNLMGKRGSMLQRICGANLIHASFMRTLHISHLRVLPLYPYLGSASNQWSSKIVIKKGVAV